MDIDISRWILEFILRQPLQDYILDALIGVLPLPNDHVRLKKALIVQKIQSEISNGSVSEKILKFLELMEELYTQEGIEASEAMQAAYCAVAVDCTVRFLGEKVKYFEAVKRIWKQRINKMENVGVVSKELWEWRDEIEAALWEDRFCDNVKIRSKSIAAVEAVKVFVEEAKERIGPPFLQVLVETLRRDDDAVKAGLDWQNKQVSQDLTCSNHDREANKGDALLRRKHIAVQHTRGTTAGICRGVKIAEPGVEASCGPDDLLSTPKTDEALKLSSLELRAVVKDPLPEALDLAETLMSLDRNNSAQQPAENDNGRAPNFVVDSNGVVRANEDDQHCCHHNAAPKPSLMARNNTAHTFEWNDSIDDLSEGSPRSGRRFTLPSPRRTKVSPLKKYEFKKVTTRRKAKRWSTLEEDTLRSGVQKYGVGNWKLIFDTYREIFEDRTPVDLKDKWRNLTS
ncbi:uncharacterized protein LOC132644325 isoform X2 [Lycium barbarum]|uniref:uncharacterized protein LOC132644325 isoform X2 n=1 Tax=Lycium barbarum TaxID=112863 RepID=UPI00293E9738|nr:uncharacterized protein LOC132644325 isoform X2 [Lycium barbarum]